MEVIKHDSWLRRADSDTLDEGPTGLHYLAHRSVAQRGPQQWTSSFPSLTFALTFAEAAGDQPIDRVA